MLQRGSSYKKTMAKKGKFLHNIAYLTYLKDKYHSEYVDCEDAGLEQRNHPI